MDMFFCDLTSKKGRDLNRGHFFLPILGGDQMTLMTPVKSFKSNESVAQDLPLPPWATNMQMMSPLLFAYEEGPDPLEPSVGKKQHGVGGKAVVFF